MVTSIKKQDSFESYAPVATGPSQFFLFQRFADFRSSCRVLLRGTSDMETKLDAILQICGDIPGFLYSSVYLSDLITTALTIFKLSDIPLPFKVLSKFLPIFGTIVTGFDGALTAIRLGRTHQFLQNMQGEKLFKDFKNNTPPRELKNRYSKTLENHPDLQKILSTNSFTLDALEKAAIEADLSHLETYLNPKKNKQLAGRVQPWCQKRVINELPTILKNLKSNDKNKQLQALAEGKDLLKLVKEQAEKTESIHILSLIALTLTGIGFAAILVGCPYLIPVFFLALGFTGTLMADTYASAILHTEGRDLHFGNCIPSWVKRYILCMDLEKDSKNFKAAMDELEKKNIPSAKQLIEKIEDSYLRAEGYYLVTKEAKEDDLLKKIQELSLFYFHRAEEALQN